ncbi:hypothetical protein PC118_g16016 [Phytophthora cactorum]|uniref:Uncharacterized protein n=1 Tax=Phytophthora cactorum TaxID=29920 RepID=A0A8T1FG81_9STRA|nr:hypothetical protein PC118_g16016 [Phytophthora cactorum]
MPCHRGFWVYASTKGKTVSANAALFARSVVDQDDSIPEERKEKWLRDTACTKLRKAWKLLGSQERKSYFNGKPESSFPIDEYPDGIMDGRKDRSRYPKMIPAHIDTPEVVNEVLPQAQTQATSTSNKSTKDQVDQVRTYRKTTLEAVITREVSALAFAVKSGDILKGSKHAIGVTEGLGATIANGEASSDRGAVASATEAVVRLMSAARTQFALDDFKEAESEVAEAQQSAPVAALDGQFGKLSATMSDSEPEVHVPSAGLWKSSPIAKEWHENWEAFKDYLERYQEDTHQLFRLRNSTSVARRNAEIKDHAGGSSSETSDSEPMLIPQEFKTFWPKYICTHGWRRKRCSTGQRKAYFGKSTECKADIKAAVTWNKEERKFMVRVTGSSTSHNHRVDRAVYENNPSVRRVEDPVLLAFVDAMQSSGSKPKRIMQFLREKTDAPNAAKVQGFSSGAACGCYA